ncbi:NAD(P)-dependent oxidoreductase [Microtetraspora sp. NBRC 13810]|uniref:NAD-dependent epimerase/dehydratase family protein n=1 Tax=Microtetraspora sp. NBRC 13810 TaxID=3030990 RepID=UPI002553C560|nr:NAD(P)-dependent oxidoreductase [Microtetraspora sp. NBRC 13810]
MTTQPVTAEPVTADPVTAQPVTAGHAVVLGGTGWVGRHVCAAFARHGYKVTVVARHRAPHLAGHAFQPCDLATATPGAIEELLRSERTDVVVNATDAANAADGWDRTEADLTLMNVDSVERLLTAVGRLPWEPRLVQIGTVHEYGPVVGLIGESVEPRPANAYARTKLQGSEAVLDAARAGSVRGVVLRLANVCGPHPSPASFPGKLLDSLRRAAAGEHVSLTVADAHRDFLDVRDAAEAALLAARATVTGTAINLGSGVAVSMRELVTQFLAVTGLPATAVSVRDAPVPSLGGDWTQVDVEPARRLLGWRPRTDLRRSLQAMWEARG